MDIERERDRDRESVTEFRLGRVEQSFKELRGELKELGGSLGGGLLALQTQLSAYQTAIADRYVTRRDYDRSYADIETRLQKMVDREENDRTRVWVALAALGSLGSFVAAALSWFRPGH